MTGSQKRKGAPSGDVRGAGKRSKGGNKGKWQTTHGAAKSAAPVRGGSINPGDKGIWATCMRSKEGKATEEMKDLFSTYASKFYDLDPSIPVKPDDEDEEEDLDIEASIAAELNGLAKKQGGGEEGEKRQFQPVFLDVACVLFFKTHEPIEPVSFVRRICEDLGNSPSGQRRSRFINRLTPMSLIGKATEKGLTELARDVLFKDFELVDAEGRESTQDGTGDGCSYAIRPSIRNHSLLKRDVVIPLVAGLIGKKHKVNLGKPDKIIIIEIYQTICGISVVDGPRWEELKRYNLFEIYEAAEKKAQAESGATFKVAEIAGQSGQADDPVSGGEETENV